MEPSPTEVGQRIKQIRNQKGLSQKEFAKRTKSTIPAISNWENGRNLPNKERLKTIADLAEISVGELLYGVSENYIRKIFDELKDADDEFMPFIINSLHNSNNYYPTRKEVIDEYNEVVDIVNDASNKFTNKRVLANNLITTEKYLALLLNQSTRKESLIKKAVDENKSAIKNFELYFEEKISEQTNPKKIN